MSLYRVTGTRAYRGHEPNTVFEASLNKDAESRAINRGAITVIDSTAPSIQPGSYTPPKGWTTTTKQEEE